MVKHVLRRSAGRSVGVWKAVEIAVCSTARIIKSLSLPHTTRSNLMRGTLVLFFYENGLLQLFYTITGLTYVARERSIFHPQIWRPIMGDY